MFCQFTTLLRVVFNTRKMGGNFVVSCFTESWKENSCILQETRKKTMKLKRFLLRYYPPGIILEYERSNGFEGSKTIDLLDISEQ